jgi:hypothetical protein
LIRDQQGMTPNVKVAVVGAGTGSSNVTSYEKLTLPIGPTGLAALKNLREEDFEVTAFEKGPTIGGLWRFNPDPNVTTALPCKFEL